MVFGVFVLHRILRLQAFVANQCFQAVTFAPLKGSCFFRFCGRRRPAADAARDHQQLQQKKSKLSVLVASQMDITSYLFDRFKVP